MKSLHRHLAAMTALALACGFSPSASTQSMDAETVRALHCGRAVGRRGRLLGLGPIGTGWFFAAVQQIPLGSLNAILPYRESTPFLRSLTGFLFGWTTGWFTIPLVEETMQETRQLLAKKFAILKS